MKLLNIVKNVDMDIKGKSDKKDVYNNHVGMQNLKTLANTLLLDLIEKESKGQNINKIEFDVMMEAYKKTYETNIENSNNLTPEQKKRLKHLYNNAADSMKDYCQECLRIEGRLVE